MDTVDRAIRSKIMSSVGQRNTGPEICLRCALHRNGFRYRLNNRDLPGSPDLVFPRLGAVIFVHGCFWHTHKCKFGRPPSSRRRFWTKKFTDNKKRDKKKIDSLLKRNWRVLVVWECAIKKKRKAPFNKMVSTATKWLNSNKKFSEIE